MAGAAGLRPIEGGRRRILVLEVAVFEDPSEGLRESLRALRPRPGAEVRRIPATVGRILLMVPIVQLLKTLKRRRVPTITALAEAVGRDAGDVRRDLAFLERVGVVRLRDPGRPGGPMTPELRYDAIELRLVL
jgi:hypothetical protein